MQEIIKDDECFFILFLCHHSKQTYGFYATNLFAWGLAVL
jgi:hypothetical protein